MTSPPVLVLTSGGEAAGLSANQAVSGEEQRWELPSRQDTWVLGRSEERCDVLIQHDAVSRVQCELSFRNGEVLCGRSEFAPLPHAGP